MEWTKEDQDTYNVLNARLKWMLTEANRRYDAAEVAEFDSIKQQQDAIYNKYLGIAIRNIIPKGAKIAAAKLGLVIVPR